MVELTRAELEAQLAERTAALQAANERLQRELAERKRVEEEREKLLGEVSSQSQRFRAVVENAPMGIGVVRGPQFVVELVNPVFQALAPGRELVGKPAAEAEPELAPQILPLLEQVWRTGEPLQAVDAPIMVRRAPGGPLEQAYFSLAYVPLREPNGQLSGILLAALETTDEVRARQQTEELARAAERRAGELRGVIDSLVDAVFVVDAGGQLALANEAALRVAGVAGFEGIERVMREPQRLRLRRPDGTPVGLEDSPIRRALAGQIVESEDEVVTDPRTRRDIDLRVTATPIRDRQGGIAGAVAVIKDVTEVTELGRLKDQFISVAAHELKTPVTVMKGYAQALLQAPEGPSGRQRSMLEAINRGADRIARIVEDLLDISRLQAGRLELEERSIDLLGLVQGAIERMAATTTRHRIRLVRAEPATVRGDPDRLEQVLVNLLSNAIKYSPRGGDIDVTVTAEPAQAEVTVRDYGVGIPKERQPGIFERFYRAHVGTPYDYGGIGVGLYISREIVSRHGGTMGFESEEGKGSTFHFTLPLAAGERAGAPRAQASDTGAATPPTAGGSWLPAG